MPMNEESVLLTERLSSLRPKLHRYCSRMTGSVVDGEDIVQDVFIKVLSGSVPTQSLREPDAWLFRVAHNASLDFLRRRGQLSIVSLDDADNGLASLEAPEDQSEVAATSLGVFMRLSVPQRSTVILMDVLGYSLEEIASITRTSLAATKSALHRGRAKLRELASRQAEPPLPPLPEADWARLRQYVLHFNAREFDHLRDMLADDVRLDIVGRMRLEGRRDVGKYFTNYGATNDWMMAAGTVDRRPAVLVFDSTLPSREPRYFVVLEWDEDRLQSIRDFRYATYVADLADMRAAS
jgi:RNA polymerase sigma-70 factor (ECF subfamily)